MQYTAQSAIDAQSSGYGSERYWDYLERSAREKHDRFAQLGEIELAKHMLTRSLGEALAGNEGA